MKKKLQAAMFFDLSAAYDVLDRDIFLKKAEICGIKGAAICWLRSYLSDRSQIVQVGHGFSTKLQLDSGTPQGSSCSCSCLVFALFVGDLALWIGTGQLGAYADDTFLTVDGDNEAELRNKLEAEGANILKYFASNRLVANPSKTALVVFRPKAQDSFRIKLSGEVIEETSSEKLLGVYVQNDLKWTKQIEKLTSEVNYAVSVLARLKVHLGKKELGIIADGLVMSKIRYCLPVFAAESLRLCDTDPQAVTLKRLQLAQNDMLRVINHKRRRDHIRIMDMLEGMNMLSVNQLTAYALTLEPW